MHVHVAAIEAAAKHEVSVLLFPELSLTGYEPNLAPERGFTSAYPRLVPHLALSRQHQVTAIVGAPLRNPTGKPALGAVLITAAATIEP